ncbi:MAG: nitroreductase [Pseudomonadota bacterium]
MDVSAAVATRKSCRAYLDHPVDPALLRDILVRASQAASGGNLQPWRVWMLTGDTLADFKTLMAARSEKGLVDTPEYPVYPSPLKSPYRDARFAVGEEMYDRLGIPRDDKPARLAWFARNYQFFGAPAAAFFYLDRDMTVAQWTDMGAFVSTVMLLATEAGLSTCAQEAWVTQWEATSEFLGAPSNLMLFAGMAIGYADEMAPVNGLKTRREPPETWLFHPEGRPGPGSER